MISGSPSFWLCTSSVRSAIVAFGLTAPLAALAELSNDTLVGPGLRLRPAYDGSASQQTELVPVVRYFAPLVHTLDAGRT